jgi:hypothetical protein
MNQKPAGPSFAAPSRRSLLTTSGSAALSSVILQTRGYFLQLLIHALQLLLQVLYLSMKRPAAQDTRGEDKEEHQRQRAADGYETDGIQDFIYQLIQTSIHWAHLTSNPDFTELVGPVSADNKYIRVQAGCLIKIRPAKRPMYPDAESENKHTAWGGGRAKVSYIGYVPHCMWVLRK